MNANAIVKVDKATFFRFIERQAEGRYEYDRGRIVQHMNGGTLDHMRITQRFVSGIERRLGLDVWVVTSQGRGVETSETVRYPEVVLEALGGASKGLSTDCPVLLVEVQSPSTKELDLNVKPAEYMSLASLAAYIVASQDTPDCLLWLHDGDGRFPDAPLRIEGRNAVIDIAALGLALPLAEIYQGIG